VVGLAVEIVDYTPTSCVNLARSSETVSDSSAYSPLRLCVIYKFTSYTVMLVVS